MPAKTEIKTVHGFSRLLVNGKYPPSISYHNRQNDFYDYMKRFADTGTELYFSYVVRNWNHSWDVHFEKVEKQLDTILAFNKNIYVILGLYLSANEEWAKANPDELCRTDGKPEFGMYRVANTEVYDGDSGCVSAQYSFTSNKFDEIAKDHIDRTLDFLETYRQKNRVIGLFFSSGTSHEWNAFTPDPGPTSITAFRSFLKKKYKSESALRKAWNDPNASFNEILPPTPLEISRTNIGMYRDPSAGGRRINDWLMALADAKTQRIITAGKLVKNRYPNMLTGCFHGNHYKDDGLTINILKSNAVDFLVSPPQYQARCPGQHMPHNQVTDSFHAHKTLFFSKDDVRAFDVGAAYVKNLPYMLLPYQGDAVDIEDSLAVYEKGLGYTIAKGIMGWYFHFQDRFFKEEPRYFEMNELMTKIASLNIKRRCKSVSEILMLGDAYSSSWLKPGSRLIQKQVDRELTFEAGYIGAPYDFMYPESLEEPGVNLDRYKLIYILSNQMATAKQRRIINKLKSNGRTIVFGHGAGFLSDKNAGIENMKSFTGFNFEQLNLEQALTVTCIDTVNPLSRYLPIGYTFGQSVRPKRLRADTKGNPLFPPPLSVSPVFAVADKDAIDVGFYNIELPFDYQSATKTKGALSYGLKGVSNWPRYFVGLALKEHGDWNSIYAGTPTIPAGLLRAICKYAGVHLFLETDDIVYANNKFLVLHTNERSGEREVALPNKTNVYDLKTGKVLAENTKTLLLDCPARRTRLLWLDNKPPVL
ncbi:MAG: hypothetical protein GX811_00155 [Lentisphaerae bacterium]|nr:hypothetical protein [Lentisphaerota bacterium]